MANAQQQFGKMAGLVLNSTAVFRLNFCASISATSPSCKPLSLSVKKPTAQTAHLVFADTRANAEKTKRAVFCHRTDRRTDIKK